MKSICGDALPVGHYSPAVISGNTVYLSGQTSADPVTGLPVAGGIQAETRLALENHSTAGRGGNPLSHTVTGQAARIKLNGQLASEFMLYGWACALEGVPSVFLSGDKMLCEDSAGLHPCLLTVPVKEGIGSRTCNYSPETTLRQIRETAQRLWART